MSVEPHDNVHREKKGRTHKNSVFVRKHKCLYATALLSSRREEGNAFKNESTTLARHREFYRIFFHVFCYSSNTCVLMCSVLTGLCLGAKPLLGAANFTRSCLVSYWLSLPHRVRPSTNPFSVSHSAPALDSFPVWISFSQSEFVVNSLWIRFLIWLGDWQLWWSGFWKPTFLPLICFSFFKYVSFFSIISWWTSKSHLETTTN